MQLQCQTRGVSAKSASRALRPVPFASAPKSLRQQPVRAPQVVRAAEVDEDAELEKRLANLRKAKGATPYKEGVKKEKRSGRAGEKDEAKPQAAATTASAKKSYDYTDETLWLETSPSNGDLAFNIVLAPTLVWLPLSLAAVGRKAFLKYKFTSKRLTVVSSAPWRTEQTDVAYQEVVDVTTVGRMLGLWGDLIVTLKDNSKVEIRMIDKYMDVKKYILERRDELAGAEDDSSSSSGSSRPRGRELSAEDLLNGPAEKKGFA